MNIVAGTCPKSEIRLLPPPSCTQDINDLCVFFYNSKVSVNICYMASKQTKNYTQIASLKSTSKICLTLSGP